VAIKWIGSSWKTALKTDTPGDRGERVYLDFRRKDYGEIAGSPTYTLIASATNAPGSHNLTGGYAQYLLKLQTSVTVHIQAHPQFLHTTGSDQPLWSWYESATRYLTLYYASASDTFRVKWRNNGTERYVESQQFDDGVSYEDIDQMLEFTFTADLTASTVGLYVNGTSRDTAWSGTPDDISTYNFNLFEVRSENGTAGDYYVNNCRVFFTTVSAAQVSNRFASVTNEEVFFPYNGCAIGSTRCNVTRSTNNDSSFGYVRNVSIRRSVETDTGIASANICDVELNNQAGEFSDDQYAAFDPTSDQFNGTSSQKYLRNRVGVIVESWEGTDFDYLFFGKVNEGGFQRTTPSDKYSTIRITAEDAVREIAHEVKRRGRAYEDKKISDATEANSLVHLVTRLATEKEIFNYASNSSFENATIGNSWSSTNCTLTRSATYALFGTYSASAVYSASGEIAQTITFTNTESLSVGQTWTWSVFVYTTASFTGTLRLAESDSGGPNASNTTAISNSGSEGWKRYEVSRTISTSASDRLDLEIEANTGTAYFDGALLNMGDTAPDFWVLNDNDGASGVESADDADSGTYDSIGFDVDAVNITHPWAIVEEGESIWETLQDIGEATAARYIGIDSSGTFKFRSPLKTGYSDPSSIETITDPMGVSSTVDYETANKIVGSGVKIVKEQRSELLWSAEDSGAFASDYANIWGIDVANGATWPDTTEFGEFWAKLESLQDHRKRMQERT
jgi:hypothetical protein